MTVKEHIDNLDKEADINRRIADLYHGYLMQKCSAEELSSIDRQADEIREKAE